METETRALIRCSLCGAHFDPDQEVTACQVCPLGGLIRSCGLVRCPRCGFEQPEPRGLQARVRRRAGGGGRGGGRGRGNAWGRGQGAGAAGGADTGGAGGSGGGPSAGEGSGEVHLSDLDEGERARVLRLEAQGPGLHKLLAMGILPGVEVAVVQSHPMPVIQTGYTTLAIDKALAQAVAVLRLEPGPGRGGRGRGRGRGGWGWGRGRNGWLWGRRRQA